ncbi:MAG TPA: cytochrome c [Fimbriiglobus sp.]|nr:cytochrome c [Fimbriiglobus sp.]
MRVKPLSLAVGLGILAIGGTVWYWDRPTPTVEPCALALYTDPTRHAAPADPAVGRVVYLDQGWRPRDSADFYSRTQGSRLLPYRWFLALEQAGSRVPFRDPANMTRLGYLPQRANPCNPDGLPVGFVRDPRRGGEHIDWLGFTCAACHTAELHHGGTAYRIDGGPGMGDLQTFLAELTAALTATRDDSAKFDRFAAAVLGGDRTRRDDLMAQLSEECRKRSRYESLNRTPHPYGLARLDAFGRIVNTVLVTALGVTDPAQGQPPDAPVSYPFLWDTPHHDYVQWNGVARNKVLGSDDLGGLARNVGEVLGVFGEVSVSEPRTASVFTGYRSSARIPDLLHLEELVRKLQSPRWPDGFPPIDEPKRKAGEELYATYCARCHPLIGRADPDRTITAVRIPVRTVGTDPRMATNFATRRGKTGRVEGRRAFFVEGDRFGPESRADDVLVHVVVGAILGSPWKNYRGARLSDLRDRGLPSGPGNDGLLVYKARPLNGVWATAPFLHNGSVPTLYDLLLPADRRPREFFVGSRRFDPVRVGFETGPAAGAFRFRTRDDAGSAIPGNSNTGHEYGSGKPRPGGGDGLPPLTDAQRWQLVEYLKSL